jgi:SAM-dependent methyltransferase
MSDLPRCRLCQSVNTTQVLHSRDCFSGQAFDVHQCADCGVASTWPVPKSLDAFYPPHYRRYGGVTTWLFKTLDGSHAAAVARSIAPRGRALEIGCGPGWISEAIRRHGWSVVSTERVVDPATIATKNRGLVLFVGDLDAVKPTSQFDLVILHQVLEHLLDPMTTLHRIAGLLKPGGKLLVSVPNFASWQARLTGGHWQHLDVPRHLSHFTPTTLGRACNKAGLRVESVRFISLERDPYGWLQSWLNQLGFSQNLLWLWLTGEKRQSLFSIKGLLMLIACLILAIPSYLLAMASWLARRGAIMEIIAVRGIPPA